METKYDQLYGHRNQTLEDAVRYCITESKLKGPFHLRVYFYEKCLYETALVTKEDGTPMVNKSWRNIDDAHANVTMLLIRSKDGHSVRLHLLNLDKPFDKELSAHLLELD